MIEAFLSALEQPGDNLFKVQIMVSLGKLVDLDIYFSDTLFACDSVKFAIQQTNQYEFIIDKLANDQNE